MQRGGVERYPQRARNGGACVVALCHRRYFVRQTTMAWMVAGAPEGWRTTLDKLEKKVVRMQGGTETGARSVVDATFHLQRTYDAPVARVWRAFGA